MNIEDFYKQARQWQASKDEQDRQREIEHQQELDRVWAKAREEIRRVLPIEGAKLYTTEPDETASYPFTGGNYQFDLVLPGVAFTPIYAEERDMKGIIRVVLNCPVTYTFKATHYYVWVNGTSTHFDNPYEAFLACCKEIGFVPENSE